MTHVITSLCLRDGGCVTVCPVECIIPGKPQEDWPLFYIDPETCIDCGACVPECPYDAIYPEDTVPAAFKAAGGEYQAAPKGTPGFTAVFKGHDYEDNPVEISSTRILQEGELVDLTPDIEANARYFSEGPGYAALE